MITLLKFPTRWLIQSDADYVERLRKQMRFAKRAAIFGLIVAPLSFAAGIFFSAIIWREFDPGHVTRWADVAPGAAIGVMVGTVSGGCVFWSVLQVMLATSLFHGFRTEKLLLKYYDQATASTKG